MMFSHTCTLAICIFVDLILLSEGAEPMCRAIINDVFNNCTNKDPRTAQIIHDHATVNNQTTEVCKNEGICRRTFTLFNYNNKINLDGMRNAVTDMFSNCCGNCANISLVNTTFNTTNIYWHAQESFPDIAFPVLGYASLKDYHGFYYIPILEVPSSYYFTLRMSEEEMMGKIVTTCLRMWPLMVITILMTVIFGFVAWIIEKQENSSNFPQTFWKGLFEGFWWSFISMTTVGYGDKIIKSRSGRMFAVVWIIIGITVIAIFNAQLTTEITSVRTHTTSDIAGHHVGALEHHLHDATIIADHGGILRVITYQDTIIGITKLFQMLQRQVIDGFILNRSTYYYFFMKVQGRKYKKQWLAFNIIKDNVIRTEKFLHGESLSYGVIMKNKTHYYYFKKYFESNWLQMRACYSLNMNKKAKITHKNYFAEHGGVFNPFLYATIGIMAVIFCFGVIYEKNRKKKGDINEDRRMSHADSLTVMHN